MAANRVATFRLPSELLDGLRLLHERDGIQPSETVRRALRAWLATKSLPIAQPSASVQQPVDFRPMDLSALLILKDEPGAIRLATAWVDCRGNPDAWFDTAGIEITDGKARQLSKALMLQRICKPGGKLDERAANFIDLFRAHHISSTAERGIRALRKVRKADAARAAAAKPPTPTNDAP